MGSVSALLRTRPYIGYVLRGFVSQKNVFYLKQRYLITLRLFHTFVSSLISKKANISSYFVSAIIDHQQTHSLVYHITLKEKMRFYLIRIDNVIRITVISLLLWSLKWYLLFLFYLLANTKLELSSTSICISIFSSVYSQLQIGICLSPLTAVDQYMSQFNHNCRSVFASVYSQLQIIIWLSREMLLLYNKNSKQQKS